MSRRIMENPYMYAFENQEFPPDVGPLLEIPFKTFRELFFCHLVGENKLWVSTSKGRYFTCANHMFKNESECNDFLNSYALYNCNRESGSSISYWVDVGDIKLSQYKKLKADYIRLTKINHLKMLVYYGVTEA